MAALGQCRPAMTQIHLLRPGTFRDMNGQEVSFTAADIAAIAKSYDPKVSRAPIVIGHPNVEDPAYGWAACLKADGDGLHAEAEDVDPAFADLVRAGRYANVSASLYRPEASGNPRPGNWYLRHIGFLGAQPPAVKGLKRAELAGNGDGIATIEFAEDGDEALWSQFKRFLRCHLSADLAETISDEPWKGDAGQYPTAEAYCEACLVDLNDGSGPKVKWKCHLPVKEPDGNLNRHGLFAAQGALIGARGGVDLPTDAKRSAAKRLAALMRGHGLTPAPALDHLANFSEAEETDVADAKELEQREASLAERETALKAREAKIAADEAAKRKDATVAFADGLVKAGKLLPADQPVVVDLLLGLKPDGKIELANGTGTKTVPAEVATRDFFSRLPQIVPLGEAANGTNNAEGVDTEDPAAIAEAASSLVAEQKAKGKTISHAEAVRRVMRKDTK